LLFLFLPLLFFLCSVSSKSFSFSHSFCLFIHRQCSFMCEVLEK
jgi:hypothetical protein